MPRPTEQQTAYMVLCVLTEVDTLGKRAVRAAQDAVAMRDRLARIIAEGGQLSPADLERLIDSTDELGAEVQEVEGNVRNLGHSELTINLARRSLS